MSDFSAATSGTSDVPSVAELIRRRRAGKTDDFVLGLAVDGGGMRGVITGAMLIALEDLGIDTVMDRHYGTSAGAMNIALFGTGGSWTELALYYDDISQNMVSMPSLTRPAFDMNYLANLQLRYLTEHKKMLRLAGIDLRFPVTDIKQRSSRIVVASEVGRDLLDLLIAGSWLPYLAGTCPTVGGAQLCDGYVLEPHTAFVAARDGCTHVLALSPKAGKRSSRLLTSARWATAASLEVVTPGLGREYLKVRRYQQTLIHDPFPPFSGRVLGTEVLWTCPPEDSHSVEAMTRGEGALLQGARAGYAAISNIDWETLE